MRVTRFIATAVAAVLSAPLVAAVPAHADMLPPHPFSADSGDACGYGHARGSVLWVTPGPLPPISVDVTGVVVDRPVAGEPFACRDDGYSSTVNLAAYSGTVEVGRQAVRANNGETSFRFSLGTGRPGTPVTHLVVQVCRDPILTLPPSYCGRAVTYRATSLAVFD